MSDNSRFGAGACLLAGLLLVGCNDEKVCRSCNKGGAEPCPARPVLAASAGDGEVTLTWEPVDGRGTAVQGWEYRQAVQGESWAAAGNTGPAATAYVVSGLTNDMAYTFQVRARFKATGFDCWSAAVSVVPRRMDDVLEQMEKHQRAIAKGMVGVVDNMTAQQELLRALGEQRIATLGMVATSTSEIANGMAEVVDSMTAQQELLRALGEQRIATLGMVATSTSEIAERSADIHAEVVQVATSVDEAAKRVDAAGQKVAAALAGIAAQLGKACKDCDLLPSGCRPLGSVLFKHNDHRIENGALGEVVESFDTLLPKPEAGLFLIEGYATSVGYAVHNLRLSDLRAACVSRCLHSRPGGRKFEFRELAKGETLEAGDPAGTSSEYRRVDVTFCPGYSARSRNAAEPRPPVWPDSTECACSDVPI